MNFFESIYSFRTGENVFLRITDSCHEKYRSFQSMSCICKIDLTCFFIDLLIVRLEFKVQFEFY